MLLQTWLVDALLVACHLLNAFAESRVAAAHVHSCFLLIYSCLMQVTVGLRGEASMGMPAAHNWAA